MAKIEALISEECWGKLQWAKVVPKLSLPSRPGHKNVLQLPKIQGFFSAWVLHFTEVPQSSSKLEFTVCYHDIMKSNATGSGNRYCLPGGSFRKMFHKVEGEGLPQLNFTRIFTGRKVSI